MDSYYSKIGSCTVHRSPLKVIINPILRSIQFYTKYPYVIVSITEFNKGTPHFIKYGFEKIEKII